MAVNQVEIALGRIRPSPSNPRKTFDEVKLQELAESIRSKGVLQPILVRPRFSGKDKETGKKAGITVPDEYELVAGERRFRACKLAKLETIPAIVRDLSDREVIEIQVIENEQRDDVLPLEKADGYHALVEVHKVKIEDLAARIGQSVGTIYGLLKLRTNLSKKGRAALEKGELSLSVAQLIIRIPGEEARDQALAHALQVDWRGVQPSVRAVKQWIDEHCMVELKGCCFNRKAPDLTSAGACTSCPKLTGNNRAEFPDARGDICTDPACFRDKVRAHNRITLEQASAAGTEILDGAKAEKALSHGGDYYELSRTCYEDPKYRTYGQLLEKELADQVVLAMDRESKVCKLLKKSIADPVLKRLVGKKAAKGGAADRFSKEQARKDRFNAECSRRAMEAIVAKVEDKFSFVLGVNGVHEDILRAVLNQMHSTAWAETRKAVLKRRNVKPASAAASKVRFDTYDIAAKDLVGGLRGKELFGLLAELAVSRYFGGGGYQPEKERKEMCRLFGVDYAAIESAVEKEQSGKGKKTKASA